MAVSRVGSALKHEKTGSVTSKTLENILFLQFLLLKKNLEGDRVSQNGKLKSRLKMRISDSE